MHQTSTLSEGLLMIDRPLQAERSRQNKSSGKLRVNYENQTC